ncbi:hypothetical protein KC19_4G031200 [Ceratodon purpureus]|uniref:Uncharacterized protein n=1 Tax=Ceratodon purpureus TaxID=3225 RepID=A0A8T0I6C4_CERPU|nr:hypothetical protein KC19_4G031200 [Ceratodon purpureus]
MSARRYHVDFGVNARNPCSVGTIVLNRSIVKSEFRHLWHLRLHIQKDLRRKSSAQVRNSVLEEQNVSMDQSDCVNGHSSI